MSSINIRKLRPILNTTWQGVAAGRVVNLMGKRLISNSTKLSSEKESEPDSNNPLRRTLKLLGRDFKFMTKLLAPQKIDQPRNPDEEDDGNISKFAGNPTGEFQTHCDILVIGGGGVGSSIAYWLKNKARDGLSVVVVEKDSTCSKPSAGQSYNGLNPHFSLPENIQMALYGADFMRGVKENLGDVNLNFTPYGSLTLASEADAEALRISSKVQNEMGVRNELLSQEKLGIKFPWLNTEGIVLGCHGLEKEGWFDPLALLHGYRKIARDHGAHFVEGEIVDFEFQIQPNVLVEGEQSQRYNAVDKAVVRLPNGELNTIKFALCVIAAGSSSGDVCRLARIGNGPGLLSIPLPIESRKRYAYIFNPEAHDKYTFSTPLTVDPNGTYFRRAGLSGDYICGRSSNTISNISKENNATEQDIFHNEIQPTLAHRVPAFKSVKVKESWTELYEYNTFDENGIIGTHPYYNNLYIAAGFNGHGIQQTPAVGRGISELIIDGRFRTIDLSRLSFDRLIVDQPLYEVSAV